MAELPPESGRYFATSDEADEWLDFECHEDEAEAKSYAENDHYNEWSIWRAIWEAGG